MDENKLLELRRIGYVVNKSCEFCHYGKFPNDSWGTCYAQTYEHLKHSDKKRYLSIYKGGYCSKYKVDPSKIESLSGFIEFLA